MKLYILISNNNLNGFSFMPRGENVLLYENLPEDLNKLIIREKNDYTGILIYTNEEEWGFVKDFLKKLKILRKVLIKCVLLVKENNYEKYYKDHEFLIDIRKSGITCGEFDFINKKANIIINSRFIKRNNKIKIANLKDISKDNKLFIDIGKKLIKERNIDNLFAKILLYSKEITGADAGSIYLIEKDKNGYDILKFKFSDTYSRNIKLEGESLLLDTSSIAGFVALTGEVLNIEDAYKVSDNLLFDLKHNYDFDIKFNYKTKSMLVVPIINHNDKIIGVIQLINSKENLLRGEYKGKEAYNVKLLKPDDFEKKVFPFHKRYNDLMIALASQAGIAIENNKMISVINNLFDNFVKASIAAIESRDPFTFGHSFRSASLCLEIAKEINNVNKGPYKEYFFSDIQLKELEYAALLHDFGKVNIDLSILLKANKLTTKELDYILIKIDYLYLSYQIDYLIKNINNYNEKRFISESNIFLKKIEKIKGNIKKINLSIYNPNNTKILKGIMDDLKVVDCFDISGNRLEIINEDEKKNLIVEDGTLNDEERKSIENHVIYSYAFTRRIPWPEDYKNIPDIIYKHHEKLDGSGYPQGLKGIDQIPVQSRILAIADIFDALTAKDRPYKKVTDYQNALKILKQEAKCNKIDNDILNIFINNKIYERISHEELTYNF
ncbi:MAG: HD domain-containing protein [Spirochaetes bacterium]|nr:HD domain-containing protein [Spirochaetota bacterium]